MERREARVWRCASGEHALGMVVRNGSGVRQLALYRNAIYMQEAGEDLEEVDVMAMVEGYAADVRCSICGRVRTWFPGEEAIRRLLESRQGGSQQGESQQGESQQPTADSR